MVLRAVDVSLASHPLAHFVVDPLVGRREGRQTIDVAVVHAERGGDEHRVVNLDVGGALGPGAGDVRRGDVRAAFCTFPAIASSALSLALTGARV